MMGIVVIGLALVVATMHLFVSRKPRTSRRVLDLYLLYTLVVGVGVGYLFAGLGHLLFADRIAEQLGWATGSPFQIEVGLYDVAFGVLGICCIWFRDQWWYATALGMSVFAVGAAINHVRDLVAQGDSSALNSASVLADLLVPVLLGALFVVRRRLERRAALRNAEA
ncbi:MAG: DUF6790 family protein [Actinomycetes bacterium]